MRLPGPGRIVRWPDEHECVPGEEAPARAVARRHERGLRSRTVGQHDIGVSPLTQPQRLPGAYHDGEHPESRRARERWRQRVQQAGVEEGRRRGHDHVTGGPRGLCGQPCRQGRAGEEQQRQPQPWGA